VSWPPHLEWLPPGSASWHLLSSFTPSFFSLFTSLQSMNYLLTELEFQAQLSQHPPLPNFIPSWQALYSQEVWGMGASQITKPRLELTATVAESLLHAVGDQRKMTSTETWSFPMLTCAHFPGWCFTAGVQYPTAIGSIRPMEPFPFPELLCCLRYINRMTM